MLLRPTTYNFLNNKILTFVSVAAVILLPMAPAFAIDKVYSPNVTQGELELEYSGNTTFDNTSDKNNIQSHEPELEYGLTNNLMLELSGFYEKQPHEHLKATGLGLGGRYEFFEQGEAWLDSGILFSYNHATQAQLADSIELKLLLEKQSGNFLHRTNLGISQDVGLYAHGGPDRVFLWNSRYRLSRNFEPGFEIQSDFGKPNQNSGFDQQDHYIGPAIFGQIMPNFKYEAAYYFGVSQAASKGAARVLLEYEIYF